MFSVSLLLIVLACWLLLVGAPSRRPTRRSFVRCHPQARAWLRGLGLAEAADFFRLDALIISGHPGRSVGRLTLGEGGQSRTVYLKREDHVGPVTRWHSFLSGHGWASRSVREARVLAALEQEGLPAPRWLAAGEDSDGRAFLLLEAEADCEPLPAVLAPMSRPERERLARRLGRALARLHGAGFCHHDLYAKHVLVRGGLDGLCLLDWQRGGRRSPVSRAARARDLACLHATLADDLACPRVRLTFLRAYLGTGRPLSGLAAEVEAAARRLRRRRHVREKRQPPPQEPQAWVRVDGDCLCVTPGLAALTAPAGGNPAADAFAWLHLDGQPVPPAGLSRRWVELPGGGGRALLLRRRAPLGWLNRLRLRVLRGPVRSEEMRLSTLLNRLERHGVPAPRALATGQRYRECGQQVDSFLLVAPVGETTRLSFWLGQALADERLTVAERLGQMLARLHDGCCYLAGREESLAVQPRALLPALEAADGAVMRRRPCSVLARADLHRVAALLSRGATGDEVGAMLRGYEESARASPERISKGKATKPTSKVEGQRMSPGSLWRRLFRGAWRAEHRADWVEFVGPDWPDRILGAEVTDRFSAKQGRSTGRWVLATPDGRRLVVYLKRHHQLPVWRRLAALLWPGGNWSPAMQECTHLQWAREQGVPVPATVAAGELIGPWGRLQSFLAVEELTDMLPLNEAIPLAAASLPPDELRRWKRGLVAEMARLARLLHDRRNFHKDLYLCHFYLHRDDTARPVAPADWRGRLVLIDLHRLTHYPWTWRLWQIKDLAQLLYSSDVPGVEPRDRVAFWAAYRGPDAHRWWSRWLRRLVTVKWHRYRQHNLRNKQRQRRSGGGTDE